MALPILNLRPRLRWDPTRTTTLRKRYMGEMRRRFSTVRASSRVAVVDLDVFGLKEPKQFIFHQALELVLHALPEREAYRFLTKPGKVDAFNKWFQEQVDQEILTTTAQGNPWTAKYVHSAYKQGSLRAYMDSHPEAMEENLDFYKGRRSQFLESAFNQPERLAKLRLLYSRSFEDLKGITAAMSQQIGRHLADGISHGLHPSAIARTLVNDVNNITKTRALVMARTEVIHAHAEGQLDSFEDLGVKELQVMAEWSTAADDLVCPKCEPLEGTVMTVDEARGLIPRHPNCRCAWIPANVGEERRKRYWTELEKKRRINKSLMAELPKKTRAGVKVPQTVKEAKRRSTWPGKLSKPKPPPAGVDLAPVKPKPVPKPKPAPKKPKPKPSSYRTYRKEMEQKYGPDKMWAEMSDDELERLEQLEAKHYASKKVVQKEIASPVPDDEWSELDTRWTLDQETKKILGDAVEDVDFLTEDQLERILPINEIRSKNAFEDIYKSMKEKGWVGRPLLMAEDANGLKALTGSHRIYAARKAGVQIPVWRLSEEALEELEKRGLGLDDLLALRDEDKVEMITLTKDKVATRLMGLENAENINRISKYSDWVWMLD